METTHPNLVIAEVRAVLDEHAARFGYDVPGIFRDIQSMQKSSGKVFVRHPARKVSAKLGAARH